MVTGEQEKVAFQLVSDAAWTVFKWVWTAIGYIAMAGLLWRFGEWIGNSLGP